MILSNKIAKGQEILCIAANGTNLFVGTLHEGLYIVENGGKTMSNFDFGFPFTNIYSLAANEKTIVIGAERGTFLSIDNGKSWNAINNGLEYWNTFYELTILGDNIYGRSTIGKFKITKNGEKWKKIKDKEFPIIPENKKVVIGANTYSIENKQLMISTNNGVDWAKVYIKEQEKKPAEEIVINKEAETKKKIAEEKPKAISENPNEHLSTAVQQGHNADIYNISFDTDGNFLTSSQDGTARLWSKQGNLIKIIPFPFCNHVEFTPDGKNLIGEGNIYDLNGKADLQIPISRSTSAISSDGNTIAVAKNKSNPLNERFNILLIDRKGNTKTTITSVTQYVTQIAFSPDGQMLAVGAGSKTPQTHFSNETEFLDTTFNVVLMNLNGTIQKKLPVKSDVLKITFSPDGKKIIALTENDEVWIWNSNGTLIKSFKAHAYEVSYSPDNNHFILGGYYFLDMYDSTGTKVQSFKDYSTDYNSFIDAKTQCCRYSKDGKTIVSASIFKDIIIWDLNGNQINKISPSQFSLSTKIEFLSKNDCFFSASYYNDALWSMDGKRITIPKGSDYIFSEDEHYAAYCTKDFQFSKTSEPSKTFYDAFVFSLDGGTKFKIPHVSPVKFIENGILMNDMNPNNPYCYIYDLKGKFKDSIIYNPNQIYSPDNNYYLISTCKGGVSLYDKKGTLLKKIEQPVADQEEDRNHEDQYIKKGAMFSPDSKIMVIQFKRSTQIWDISSLKLLGEISNVYVIGNTEFFIDMTWINRCGNVFISKNSKQVQIKTFYGLNTYDLSGKLISKGPDIHNLQTIHHTISPDGTFLISSNTFKILHKISTSTGSVIGQTEPQEALIGEYSFSADSKRMLTKDYNGNVKLWNTETMKEIASFYSIGANDYAITTPDGFYTASKYANQKVHFVKGMKTFTFDNFDLIYNRPDIIYERLGNTNAEMKTGLKNAYLKRLKKMGFTEDQVSLDIHLPEVNVLTKNISMSTDQKMFNAKLKITDSKYLLNRINIYVNDVPLYGSKGMSLVDAKTSDITKDIQIELTNGKNIIQFAAMNDKGAESLKEAVNINYTGPVVKPVLYVVAIGVSDYSDNDYDLKYAAKDATDLATLLETNKAKFADVKVLKILDINATTENIRQAKKFLEKSKADDEVILFTAGHGLLDDDMNFYFATSNIDFKNPSKLGLPYEDLEGLIDGIPARKKIMFIDACNSGEVDKDETVFAGIGTPTSKEGKVASRGFKMVQKKDNLGLKNSFDLMQELFSDLRKGSGAIVISSASGTEFAFESSEWKNGVFTYSLLEWMKTYNASSNTEYVKVSKLRDYVFEKVSTLTNGKQHPTSRKENLEFDFNVW